MENKPICYVPSRKIPEVFSGVPTFAGLPKIEKKEELSDKDFVVMGVPWEGVCTWGGFSGCELSTKTIRQASARYGGFFPDYDIDIFDHMSGGDYGDTAVKNGDYDFSFGQMRSKLGEILEYGKIPIIFGGDHSISYPLIGEFAKKHKGRIGVIHFDAHMDNVYMHGEDKYARCSPFYRLYEDENVDATKMVHFGIRGPRNHPSGLKAAKQFGATVLTALEVKRMGIDQAVQKAIDVAFDGTEAVYITICSDVLDVANNPAGPPDPCGLTSFEMAVALNACGKAGAKAFDFVELYPGNDPNGVSSHVASWLALHFMAGVAQRKIGR